MEFADLRKVGIRRERQENGIRKQKRGTVHGFFPFLQRNVFLFLHIFQHCFICRPSRFNCVGGAASLLQNPIYVSSKKELGGLSPNFHIHVSVKDLYIPRISPQKFSCGRIGRPIVGIYINRSQNHECGNRDSGRTIPFWENLFPNFGIVSLQCIKRKKINR
jgi:hypothetical protein